MNTAGPQTPPTDHPPWNARVLGLHTGATPGATLPWLCKVIGRGGGHRVDSDRSQHLAGQHARTIESIR